LQALFLGLCFWDTQLLSFRELTLTVLPLD